jgi:hypothetical protein
MMTQKVLILAAAAATVAVTSLAVTSSAEAGAHHRFYGHYGAYKFTPWYARGTVTRHPIGIMIALAVI